MPVALLLWAGMLLPGCARVPSPLTPALSGSVGLPHRGVLTGGEPLPDRGPGWKRLRADDRRYALPRMTAAIERAAAKVAEQRPSATLVVGDLSSKEGGRLLPHLSHRTGRDADLLLYAMTVDGAPVESPGFVHYGPDGLAWDEEHKRFLRFDVEREWQLVRALVEDEEARVQWIFASRVIEAMLIEWARARGEPAETILRAEEVMAEPSPGGAHDDHVHVRTACAPEDLAHGCEPSGPTRPWLMIPEDQATKARVEDLVTSGTLEAPQGE